MVGQGEEFKRIGWWGQDEEYNMIGW